MLNAGSNGIVNQDGHVFVAHGDTPPPDGTNGYAAGCLFVDTDSSLCLVNSGTADSCNFTSIAAAGSSIFESADGIDCNPGSDIDCDLITVGVTGTPKLWWDESIDAFSLTKGLWVGGVQTTNSTDPMINVNRAVDGATNDNAHCFSDSSTMTRGNGTAAATALAYNSFDARMVFGGTQNYNHYAAFQAAPVVGTSGTIVNVYGLISAPTVSSGTVTNVKACAVNEVAGAGTVTNNYGVYVAALTKGATSNYAIYTVGATWNYLGGHTGIGVVPTATEELKIGGAKTVDLFKAISITATATQNCKSFQTTQATSGTGNIVNQTGIYVAHSHGSSGTLTTQWDVLLGPSNAGGTIATRYGIQILDQTGAGALTNQYGLHIAALAKGGTLNYAIYTAGATPSVFEGPVTVGGLVMADATNIVLNTTTGTKIGTANTQKLGFFNATPIVQPTVATDATVATLITALTNLGLIKNS